MVPKSNTASMHFFRIVIDALTIFLSFFLSEYLVTLLFISSFDIYKLWMPVVFMPVFMFFMYFNEMYSRSTFFYSDRTIRNLSLAFLMATLTALFVMPFVEVKANLSRDLFVYLAVNYLLMLFLWLVVHRYNSTHSKLYQKNAIIIGERNIIQTYIYYLGKSSYNSNVIGYILTDGMSSEKESIRNLGELQDLESILASNVIDEVIFTISNNCIIELEKYVTLCEERGLMVRIALDLFPMRLSKSYVHHVGTIPVLTYHTVSLNEMQLFMKRVLDIVGSAVGLLITLLLSLIIVPAILIDSPGPILFRQKRVGQNGRVFFLYKFRSMVTDAEQQKVKLENDNVMKGGLMFKIHNDPRVTKVGAFLRKTSLDELPQFINVMKGEMSLVGTRPPTVDEVNKYQNPHHRRISIKPGITGNWQVNGRSLIHDFDEVVKLDTVYIDNWSIWKDIGILIKTFYVVLFKRDAF